jgi:ABC-type bacteriocin/lantibiotic exporter with double-glycine peptidase domain
MSQSTLTPTQRFWRLLKPDGDEIQNVYAYATFSGLVSLSLPLGIQAIVNLIQGGRISTSWVLLVTLTVLGTLFAGILQVVQLRITERLQQRIFTRAAFEFAIRLPAIKVEELYQKYAPELMNRFFDVMSVQKGLSKLLIDVVAAGLQAVFGLLLLSIYHPFFTLFNVVVGLVMFLLFRWTSRRGLSTSIQESSHKYEVAHWLEELARTASTFKLAGRTSLPLSRTDHHVENYLASRRSHFRVLMTQYTFLVAFKVIVVAGLLIIGGIMVMEQAMNIGQFIAAEIIVVLLMNSVEKLVLSIETAYDVLTSLEKIGQVTDLALESDAGDLVPASPPRGMAIELQNICYQHPGQATPLFTGFNASISPGERILITGPQGSGKSTFLQFFAGLVVPQDGRIAFNGQPMRHANLTDLRSNIGEVLDDQLLFAGSIAENISLGRPGALEENVRWAIEQIGLKNWVDTTEKGIHTQLNPAGQHLPQNIIQRLLLARSIATKPALLVLENPLGPFMESVRHELVQALTGDHQPWTLIVVSDDPEMRAACTREINLSNS